MAHTDYRIEHLRQFVGRFAALLEGSADDDHILAEGAAYLADLVSVDDWLPSEFAQPSPERYQQYLLHCDSSERFSIVSFVWGPGQFTPIHDHGTWGLIGVLRGGEISQSYDLGVDGLVEKGPPLRMKPGDVDQISPRSGDIHQVRNMFDDRTSVSIHVYGANIGRVQRSVFMPDGSRKAFVSAYANSVLPNLWA